MWRLIYWDRCARISTYNHQDGSVLTKLSTFTSLLLTLDNGTNLRMLIQLILQCLSDPALLVQIEYSKTLHSIIEVQGSEVKLLPILPHILHKYF